MVRTSVVPLDLRRLIIQTFLPYPDFEKSARCLDRLRLGKQRVEVLTLLRTLNGDNKAWRSHPATRMWNGYTEALIEYGLTVCREWLARGYKDNCYEEILTHTWGHEVVMPPWFGNTGFHMAHKSNLIRKFPEHYRKYWPRLRDDLPYVWPV